jgi:predicted nucleic acid-binding protein
VTLVVDASVALKWVLAEPGQAAAEALLDEDLIAPSLWLLEAANALWRRNLRGELGVDEAEERLSELFNAPVTSIPIEEDLSAAVALAQRLGHPVYDCLYLALAMREQAQVVTADRRFWTVVQTAPDLAGWVRLLEG